MIATRKKGATFCSQDPQNLGFQGIPSRQPVRDRRPANTNAEVSEKSWQILCE